jgi:hypothetical protein
MVPRHSTSLFYGVLMNHSLRRTSVAVLVMALAAVAPTVASAQIARTRGTDGPPPNAPKGIPRDARRPFAGVWDGSFTLRGSARGERSVPMILIVNADDAAKAGYTAERVLPGGERVPPMDLTVMAGEIRWRHQNSGGGYWVYAGKMVGRDTLTGTVALTDWPQLAAGEKPPTGTFSLVRRSPGA